MTYEFEMLSAETARKDFPAVWETARAALPHLTEAGVAIVVSLVVDTCSSCHESSRKCSCWNDE